MHWELNGKTSNFRCPLFSVLLLSSDTSQSRFYVIIYEKQSIPSSPLYIKCSALRIYIKILLIFMEQTRDRDAPSFVTCHKTYVPVNFNAHQLSAMGTRSSVMRIMHPTLRELSYTRGTFHSSSPWEVLKFSFNTSVNWKIRFRTEMWKIY